MTFVSTASTGNTRCDIAIVGYGPVGQVLSLLLARRGWRIVVLDQWPTPYSKPRAVSFDGHAARILATAGVDPAAADICEPSADYVVTNGAAEALLRIELRPQGRHGWPDSTSVYLPGLERALTAAAQRWPGLHVMRGLRVTGLNDRGGSVDIIAADSATGREQTISARWVIGCDGANSFVRAAIGAGSDDMGFSRDWMACDVVPHDPSAFTPRNLQVADPIRPRVAVSAGPGHSRWEFMRMPTEPVERFNSVENAWRLLSMFDVTPGWGALSRYAVYRFAARNAQRWRVNRVLLAGDAAHQMPPFAGQGMCSGFRDAANVAWKLDLVLRGVAAADLLDSYESECRPQAQAAINLSVGLGRLICLTDPAAAAQRDAAMRATGGPAAATGRGAGDLPVSGFVHTVAATPAGSAGALTPQGRVAWRGRTGRFDEIVGGGFALLCRADIIAGVDARTRRTLARLGVRVWRVVAEPRAAQSTMDAVTDVDDVYLPWLAAMDAVAVLIRPDAYVYGTARDAESLTLVVKQMEVDLGPVRPGTG